MEGLEFFHINRSVNWSVHQFLTVGHEVEVGAEINPYFAYFERTQKTFPITLNSGQVIQPPAVKFLGLVALGEVNSPNLPQIAFDVARHFVTLARELFWESVRLAEFPDRPSRQRCLWVCPSLENARDWLSRLECKNYQILKVSVNGRLHTANELLLLGDSEPLEITRAKAREYWQGLQVEGGSEEILFEGRMKVLEILETKSAIAEPPCTPF
jgi:hypothetical protein